MDSRSRLIAALRALARQQALEDISYRALAQAAGVSVPTAKRYLGDRSDFARLLAEEEDAEPVNTREKILAAAAQVFAEQGYAGASLDAIAGAAQLTKGAIYWHFSSKADLFCVLLEERCKRETDSIAAAFTHDFVQKVDLEDIQNIVAHSTQPLITDRYWARLFIEFVNQARDPDITERLSRLYGDAYEHIAALQQRLREAGRTDPSFNDEIVAKFWAAIVDGLTVAYLANPKATDVLFLAQEFARIAWLGLRHKNTTTGESS